ncbi:MAG TPA: hypothetical protein VF510_19225 [Ktedonobacterales bacterium]
MSITIEPGQHHDSAGRARPQMPLTGLRLALVLAGFAVGIASAISVNNRYDDGWLAFFVFAMVVYTLGWGVAEVVTRTHRMKRALYFVLEPVASVAVLYGAYALWGRMWLAVILGFVVGGMLHSAITWLAMPRIAAEEAQAEKWDPHADREGTPASSDVARKWAHGLASHPIRSIAVGMVTDRYYTAIKAQNYAEAYGYLAPEARATASEEAFSERAHAQDSALGRVEEFSNPPVSVEDPVSVDVFVTRTGGSYTVHLQLHQIGDAWRIAAFDGI